MAASKKIDDALPGAFVDEYTPLPMTATQAELEMARVTCNELRSALAVANATIVEQRTIIKRLRGERDTLAGTVKRLRAK